MEISINRIKILAYLVSLSILLSFLFSSFIFLIFALLLCFDVINKVKISIFIHLFFSIFFVFIDFDTFKNFLLLGLTIIIISEKFRYYPKKLLISFSYVFSGFFIYLLTLDQSVGDLSEVLLFEKRFWPTFENGQLFNPNTIGLLSAISALGFFVNKRNIFMLFPLFILLITQSRSAIAFFIISTFIYSGFKFKNIMYYILLICPFVYFIFNSNILVRFVEDGNNGRVERSLFYFYYLKDNYLTGIGINEYNHFISSVGSWDNLYLAFILVYGVWGGVYLFYLIFAFLRGERDENYKLRLAIFLSFLFLGVFEGSFAFNYLTWIIFALSFNSFSIKLKNKYA